MRDSQPRTVFMKDYQVPDYLIDNTELFFFLEEDHTEVRSRLTMRRNPQAEHGEQAVPLVLDGDELILKELLIDGERLQPNNYRLDNETLTINTVPERFILECTTEIKPQQNTTLSGLYKSHAMFCTQCEAQGFRRITYYLDRPDVMSTFTTTVTANKQRYPLLLSNGNNIASADNADGTHWVTWEDPHKKPAYLFALVAGDLQCREETFTTQSGQSVTLRIFVEAKDINKCEHAMTTLINAMRWDEQVYGREYDLNIFNIVAVDDFNMGAMENKSLNIFNSSCVLCTPQTATDANFQRIEGIVAHEYFHNWSGNRVTCRDWFQLSLKEGFTVFRDAQFSADMGSPTVKRVEDVAFLRTNQFAEDASPMAHPIRPESFIEISNFYTVTVYEKGAEIVRMIYNILGAKAFRAGSDLYFDRHDGQAVTCEDFVKAMEDSSGKDLTQFRRWYSQAGTPELTVNGVYDQQAATYTLTVSQSCPPTPESQHKQPFHIPLAMALLGQAGPLPLTLNGGQATDNTGEDNTCDANNSNASTCDANASNSNTSNNNASNNNVSNNNAGTEIVLDVKKTEQQFVFTHVSEKPVPSLLRGFSAPVKLSFNYTRDELMFIMSHDNDGFCRWDSAQQLGVQVLNDIMTAHKRGETAVVDTRLIDAYRAILCDEHADQAMVALMLELPTEAYMAEIADQVDAQAIYAARTAARCAIAEQLQTQLWQAYQRCQSDQPYEPSAVQIAQRSLKNTALSYLMLLETEEAITCCTTQYDKGDNMTDVMAALTTLLDSKQSALKKRVLSHFYEQWQHEPLVINQWLAVQASCAAPDSLTRVNALMAHPAFDIKNPNKARAVIESFCAKNATGFHRPDGSGYRFLADQIITLNTINPQVASRLLRPLTKWKKVIPANAALMKRELERIMAEPNLSKDVYEIVSKSLL